MTTANSKNTKYECSKAITDVRILVAITYSADYFADMSKSHLVILKKCYLDKILNDSKSIELRLTKTAVPPFNSVAIGDKLFLKESSGPVCAAAQVSNFKQFRDLTPGKIAKLKAEFNDKICGEDEYWKFKSDCRFAVLVWLKNVRTIKPVRIDKKDWRAWVVLSEGQNFGLFKTFWRCC